MTAPTRQYLLIDADDTLWENNIYFERAFASFCDFLGHSSMTPSEVRAVLDEIEIVNAKVQGYGSKKFGNNMKQCYQHLAERDIRAQYKQAVLGVAWALLVPLVSLLMLVILAGHVSGFSPGGRISSPPPVFRSLL